MSRLRLIAALIVCVLLAGAAALIRSSERRAHERLDARFHMRAELADRFLDAFIQDLLQRERRVAEKRLSGPVISQAELAGVVDAFGLEAAVVLDGGGNLIGVYPARPEILGISMTERYDHLRRALDEGTAVSAVVPSAASGSPIVAFATRFSTSRGDAVFSGAWDLSRGPLHKFLGSVDPVSGATAEIVDNYGTVVASHVRPDESPSSKAWSVAAILRSEQRSGSRDGRRFVVLPVRGTPWRLIVSVEEEFLYAPIAGIRGQVPWMLFAGLMLLAAASAYLMVQLIEGRAKLQESNAALARMARVDLLTNVMNRRSLDEELDRWRGSARRYEHEFSVLLIDIDHFKEINDLHGHAAGDQVLRELAARMNSLHRLEDSFGRWGGEEFLAILPHTSSAGALRAGERIREAVEACRIVTAAGASICATVSVGCASATGAWNDSLLERADVALYEAKALGRNRVVVDSQAKRLSLVAPLAPPTEVSGGIRKVDPA